MTVMKRLSLYDYHIYIGLSPSYLLYTQAHILKSHMIYVYSTYGILQYVPNLNMCTVRVQYVPNFTVHTEFKYVYSTYRILRRLKVR